MTCLIPGPPSRQEWKVTCTCPVKANLLVLDDQMALFIIPPSGELSLVIVIFINFPWWLQEKFVWKCGCFPYVWSRNSREKWKDIIRSNRANQEDCVSHVFYFFSKFCLPLGNTTGLSKWNSKVWSKYSNQNTWDDIQRWSWIFCSGNWNRLFYILTSDPNFQNLWPTTMHPVFSWDDQFIYLYDV